MPPFGSIAHTCTDRSRIAGPTPGPVTTPPSPSGTRRARHQEMRPEQPQKRGGHRPRDDPAAISPGQDWQPVRAPGASLLAGPVSELQPDAIGLVHDHAAAAGREGVPIARPRPRTARGTAQDQVDLHAIHARTRHDPVHPREVLAAVQVPRGRRCASRATSRGGRPTRPATARPGSWRPASSKASAAAGPSLSGGPRLSTSPSTPARSAELNWT